MVRFIAASADVVDPVLTIRRDVALTNQVGDVFKEALVLVSSFVYRDVIIELGYESPEPLKDAKATWATAFKVESILKAINEA
jgi:hypothetical protein